MLNRPRLKRILSFLLVLGLTIFLHAWAVSLLPQDFDEPVYLQNGIDYAQAFRTGGLQAVIDYSGTAEHPALVKLLYGAVVLVLGKSFTWAQAFYASRAVSAFFGVLAVVFLTLGGDPLSGAFLAVHTLAVKYTSQVYLEALPQAFTIGAVLAYLRVQKGGWNRWLWLSAGALGIAAAGKYSYLPVILIVLGYLALFEKKTPLRWLAAYAVLALAVFFVLDIHLWRDPLNRLIESLTYHVGYSQGAHVAEVGYPWYQPFIWIFTAAPYEWHPNVFFYYGFDGIFALLALAGIPREWKTRRWLVIWLAAGIVFLLLWPTKWPQYALTVTPAICLMGAETARRIYGWLKAKEEYWEYLRTILPMPSKWLWVVLGVFILFIAVIYLSAAVKLATGRVGWSNLTTANSSLPDDTVYALLPVEHGAMLIGTDSGAALWTPPADDQSEATWTIYNAGNSGLVNDEVLSLAQDASGAWWFGTGAGLSRVADGTWTTYHAADLGLGSETLLALAAAPDGSLYAGTLAGAAVYDGTTWTAIPAVSGQPVFALALGGGDLWLGSATGAWQMPLPAGAASFHPTSAAVRQLFFDSSGSLWAATSGSGLARWQDGSWSYLTNANSGLPTNAVNCAAEVAPGELWAGSANPTSAGGVPASYDGTTWHAYLTNNSGASDGEPLTIVHNSDGMIWIGTRLHGIDLYNLGR